MIPLKPESGTGDFQEATPEQPVSMLLAFRDDDSFVSDLIEIDSED